MLDRTPMKELACTDAFAGPVGGLCAHCGAVTTATAEFCSFDCHLKALNAANEKRIAELEERCEARLAERLAAVESEIRAEVDRRCTGLAETQRELRRRVSDALGYGSQHQYQYEQERYLEHAHREAQRRAAMDIYAAHQNRLARSQILPDYDGLSIANCIPGRADFLANQQIADRQMINLLRQANAEPRSFTFPSEGVVVTPPSAAPEQETKAADPPSGVVTDSCSWTGRMGG